MMTTHNVNELKQMKYQEQVEHLAFISGVEIFHFERSAEASEVWQNLRTAQDDNLLQRNKQMSTNKTHQ